MYGILKKTIIRDIKGDTRSLDYSSGGKEVPRSGLNQKLVGA